MCLCCDKIQAKLFQITDSYLSDEEKVLLEMFCNRRSNLLDPSIKYLYLSMSLSWFFMKNCTKYIMSGKE